MKILLINPPEVVVFFKFYRILRETRILPSLGLAYVGAVLKENGFNVFILDANALRMNITEIKKYIRKMNPEVVGITTATPTFRAALLTARAAKEVNKDIFTVIGGVHMTVLPEPTLKYPSIDCGIIGEGEYTMLELARCLKEKKDWRKIPGVISKNGIGPPRQRIKDIDSIPSPARELLPNDKYYEIFSPHKKATSIVTSRGCPFKCIFCEREVRGGHFRARSPAKVVDEMEEIVKKYKVKEILIYDDTFTINQKRVKEICEEILKRNLDFSWDCRTRVNCVSQDLFKIMKKAGCARVSLGIESASQKILNNLNKDIKIEDSINAVKWAKEAGIEVLAYFMLGSPGETKETIEETLRFSKEISPDYAYYSITVGYPGTDLWDLAVKECSVRENYWQEYVKNEGILPETLPYFIGKNGITRKYLDSNQKKAYRNFYIRPRYIFSRIKKITSIKKLVWHIKIAMSLMRT